MIQSLTGSVQSVEENVVEFNVGGVGFEVLCTADTAFELSQKKAEETTKILTYMQVKEDAMVLFGFGTKEEKSMFQKLISVSGIGPKMALGVLSGVKPSDLAMAILSGNAGALSTIKGVGKKTAERIVLELKEKVGDITLDGVKESKMKIENQATEDAIFALTALGIKPNEARKVVDEVATKDMSAEEIIRKSLKGISR